MDTKQDAREAYAEVPHVVEELTLEVGRFTVVGDLILPAEGERHPIIVLVWGSGPAGREKVRKPSQLLSIFLKSGFGVFVGDKPGTGASAGDFKAGQLLRERGEILAAEVGHLRGLQKLNQSDIGVYGSSQAAYVIGLALDSGMKIDFLIAVSCPATDSVEQSAYLVEQQLLCEGYERGEAAMARKFFVQRHRARSYSEYLEAAQFLDDNPVVAGDLGWGGVIPESDFTPLEADSEAFYDPSDALAGVGVPVLALFAENDTQVDPQQGAMVYSKAIHSSDSELSRVVTVPGADHNMRVSETGCLKEQRVKYTEAGGAEYASEFLENLENWLFALRADMRGKETS
ncbi:MAG: alpha/beta hydrolase [Anaerolineales bacterium]